MKKFPVWVSFKGKKMSFYEFFFAPNFCSLEIVTRGYRFKAKQFHPDVNKQDDEMMKAVNFVYGVLKRDKETYDHHLKVALGLIQVEQPTIKVVFQSSWGFDNSSSSTVTGGFW